MSDKSVRVYLAARFGRRDEMRVVAEMLRGMGYVVTSRWLDVESEAMKPWQEAEWARSCLQDILSSDAFVLFGEQPGAPGAERGGRHVELGTAIASHKEIIVVGAVYENIFHRLASVTVVNTHAELVVALRVFAQSETGAAA